MAFGRKTEGPRNSDDLMEDGFGWRNRRLANRWIWALRTLLIHSPKRYFINPCLHACDLFPVQKNWQKNFHTSFKGVDRCHKESVHVRALGGSTPKVVFFWFLAENFGQKIDWSKVFLLGRWAMCTSDRTQRAIQKTVLSPTKNYCSVKIFSRTGESIPTEEAISLRTASRSSYFQSKTTFPSWLGDTGLVRLMDIRLQYSDSIQLLDLPNTAK